MQNVSLKEFKSLFPYLKKYRSRYLIGFLFLAAVDAGQMLIPQFLRRTVDLVSGGNPSRNEILGLCVAMVAVAAVVSLGRFFWRFFIHGSARRIEAELRERLFDHLMGLSYDFYQKNKIGDLMARATNDLNAVRMSISMGFVAFIDGTVMATAILIIMFIQDAWTSALAILPLPIITVLILTFGSAVGKRFKGVQEAYSSMSDTVQETFAGIRVVKSFVKEGWFKQKFADTNDDYEKANMSLMRIFGLFFPLISFLSGLTSLILLLVGGKRVIDGRMSPGELVALFSYLQMLIWPMLGAGFMINMVQRGAASLERVNEILKTPSSITTPAYPRVPEGRADGRPAIEFVHMSFRYPDGTVALSDVSLKIPHGSMVGILGRTGSGKTTLLKTLPRMVDPPDGTIFVDGLDVKAWDLAILRRRFGVTPQDSFLFSESIKDNIAFGDSTADEDRLWGTVAIASIEKDLADFRDGWETTIGERGTTLSGGQKQRVAISRAVVRDPDILILDDAFSAVDAETEKRILGRLLEERRGKTTLIVSHRVSTLRHADLVLVLEGGRLAELGRPAELERAGGYYARMAELQRLEEPDPVEGS